VLASFPLAALGALVIYAAVRLIDVRAFRRLAAFRISELVLALSACGGVLVFNILYGVLAAVGLSVAELLLRVGRPHDAIQGLVPGLPGMHDADDYPRAELIPGLVMYRYDAPLSSPTRRTSAAGPGRSRPGLRADPLVRPQHRSHRRGRLHRTGGR
jgi:SulP family sulfate permease